MTLDEAQIEPGLRVYAIGDIHGCVDELKELLSLIEKDLNEQFVRRCKIVCLGDYVDRGPENRAVLETLMGLESEQVEYVFLLGNHDERMIKFIEDPELVWDDMMKWGGVQTLANYGVVAQPRESEKSISDRFVANVPTDHLQFLKSLKRYHEQNDYYFCHAGVRPGVSLAEQSAHDLIRIRNDFLLHEEPFEKVVVHGHTPHTRPDVKPNRINVDTRCYDSGILTALVLEGSSHRFLNTGVA